MAGHRGARGTALALLLLLGAAAGLAAAQGDYSGYQSSSWADRTAGGGYTGGGSEVAAPAPAATPATTAPPARFPAGAAAAAPAPEAGRVITVSPWTLPGGNVAPFGQRSAQVGDLVRFEWQGLHGVYRIPSGSCPSAFTDTPPLEEVAAPSNGGSATYRFPAPGKYWFACPVDGHCAAGMLIEFVVA